MSKYFPVITEATIFGFLLSCFVWGIFDCKAEIEYYYHPEYHYKPSSFRFFPLVLILILSSLAARIIVRDLNVLEKPYIYWLKILTIMYIIFHITLFFYETYLIATTSICDSCGFPKSLSVFTVDIKVWLTLLLLFGLFTPLYIFLKKRLEIVLSNYKWS
jgi:hypothetical protein